MENGSGTGSSCPQHNVVIDGNTNVCYYGYSSQNVVLTAWVDGMVDVDATYDWYVGGQYSPNLSGFDNVYREVFSPTYNNPYVFTVKVTKSDGCSYMSEPFEVNVYDRPYATITGSADEICTGDNVALQANLHNYNDPMITYQWYGNEVNSSHALPGRTHEVETFVPTSSTDYIVKVTHLMNYGMEFCVAYDTFSVQVTECGTANSDGQPCPGTPTVADIDGNIYNTVQIGEQCWTKENMRTTRYANGTNITLNQSNGYSSSTAYRYIPNNQNNVSTYGYLYNWKAVMGNASPSDANPSGVQGICPSGWHVPSLAEWNQLTSYVSENPTYVCGENSSNIAKSLSSTVGWNSVTNDCAIGNSVEDNNATGFSALPTGSYFVQILNNSYYYTGFGTATRFWCTDQNSNNNGYSISCVFNNANANVSTVSLSYKPDAHSVRCVRN